MSVEELRGQIAILLRKIDLLERQSIEREAEVLKLQDDIGELRKRNAELMDQLDPPGDREEAIEARINSLAAYAEQLERAYLGSKQGTASGGNGQTLQATPQQVPPRRYRVDTGALAAVFAARWVPDSAKPGEPVTLMARAPGHRDGADATLELFDAGGSRIADVATVVTDEGVETSWTPTEPGNYRFTAAVNDRRADSGWLAVVDPEEAAASQEAPMPAKVAEEEKEPTAPIPAKCTACAHPLAPDARFCEECGADNAPGPS